MKAYLAYLVAAPLALASSMALAGQPVDNFAGSALAGQRYEVAVATLEPMLRADPADERVALNLAMAYRYTGRQVDARRLYARVLNLDNVVIDAHDGRRFWSHDVAKAGLAQMVQISAR